MHILHVGKFYPPHRGGIETHVELLCRELAKSIDVDVVVANESRHTRYEIRDGVSIARLSTWITLASAPVCPRLVLALRRSKADLVHIHLPNPVAAAALLLSGYKGPVVVAWHSDILRQRLLGKVAAPFVEALLKRSAAIIVAAPQNLAASVSLPPYKAKCFVIPYGIDLAAFAPADDGAVERIRQSYGARLVIAIGRLVSYKGLSFLIEAMPHVRGKLLLIGTGPLQSRLKRQANVLNLNDKIVFLGDVEDTRPFIQAANLLAMPSIARTEAFGIVQLEAMACARPIVNTRLESGVNFASPHGVSGLTVEPADSMALAGAINCLLDDREMAQRMGQAGLERAHKLFNLPAMVDATLGLYSRVLGNRTARA